MKLHFSTMLSAGLLSASMSIAAQQGMPKPVLSATPVPAKSQAPVTAPAQIPVDPQSQTAGPQIQAPAVTTGDSAPQPAAEASNTYVIGADDSISVSVWKEPTLSGSFPVRPDGMISLPLVGDILASGRTPMALGKELTEKLKKFITDPTVTVTVLGVNSKRIFFVGEIGHVGPMTLTAGLTPLQAIASAGGVSAYADKKHIYILRTVDGKQKKIIFDYKKAVKTGDQQGVVLMPGDTIVVP